MAAVAVLAVTTRTWVEAIVPEGVPGSGTVAVHGGSAAAVVPALALVALAAAGALTIAGRRARVVVLAVLAVAGLGVALGAVRVVADPLGAARADLGAATGLVSGSVQDLGASVSASAWPVVASVLGLLVVAVALGGLRTGRRWDDTARFEQPSSAGTGAAARDADSQDADSPGADSQDADRPATDRPGVETQGGHAHAGDDQPVVAPGVDARDGWDALSRGDDPTRQT